MKQPFALLVLAAILLASCVGGAGFGGSSARPVLNGALNVGVPAGYCVDPEASGEAEDTAIILMGRCSNQAAVKPAVVTLAIGQAGSAGVMAAGGVELAGFFTSPQGRATLAPTGRASDVRVMTALSAGDAFLMRVQEAGEPSYWRAVLGLKGRLVTMSVKGGPQEALAPEDGRVIMDKALAALKRANPA